MVSSVYIHIPFCQQICHYCDFTKFFYNEELANEYLEALEKEISTYVGKEQKKVKTIFVGGGTPTALSASQLRKLLQIIAKYFLINEVEEFSFEANPGDFSEEKIKVMKAYGVNRISLGVQVFDNKMLEEIGRLHRIKDVYQTIDLLKGYNFTNISIDLIYGLPNQTLDHFEKTLAEALSFNLPHYSAYSLQIEPKTVFYLRHKKGNLHKPVEEVEAAMFEMLTEKMEQKGIHQYEISNFAKNGFESRHNLTYWNNDYYFGFGAGAHGYLPGKRIVNIRPLPQYNKKALETGLPILHEEPVSKRERIEEQMFLGLRKVRGVSKTEFFNRFGIELECLYENELSFLEQKAWLMQSDDFVYLTKQGRLFGNEVFEQFLLDESKQI